MTFRERNAAIERLCSPPISEEHHMPQTKRNKFFANVDAGALDSGGNQIIFGDDYVNDEGVTHNVAGLDLRARNGWVFTWNCARDVYDCVQASKLTPNPSN
jgi:hypothetical protein